MSNHATLPPSQLAAKPSPSLSPSSAGAPAAADAEAQALHHALIQWISSFSSALSRPCTHMADLADGVLLFEVAAQVDKDWFRLIGTLEHAPSPAPTTSQSSAHWIPRYNNLKKLHRLLISYLTDVLGMPDATTSASRPPILLDKIARHADAHQLAHLASLLLVVAVHSPATPHVIARIQSLETSVQALLMQVIEGYLQSASAGAGGGGSRSVSPAAPDDEPDQHVVSQAHVAQLLTEKRQIEARHRQLQQDYEQLAAEYEAAIARKPRTASSTDALPLSPTSSTSLSQPDTASAAAAAGTLTADLAIARAEIHRLHAQLAHADERTHELEVAGADQARMLADQARRLADAADQAALVRALKDQVDEMQDAGAQLVRAQAQVDKLKARLGEVAELKRQVKDGDEERVRLKAQVARYEAELMTRAKGDAGGGEVEREIKAAREWEARYLALQAQHARVVAEVESVREANARLEEEVARERERVGELVDQVREMDEVAAASRAQGESLSSLGDAVSSGRRRGSKDLGGGTDDAGERAKLVAEAAALRAQLDDLRQERETMHAQFEGHKQLLAKARALIVQANKERAELVDQHAAELTRVKSVASAATSAVAATTASDHAAAKPDAFPEAIQALQLQIEGYQRETQALWAENKALRDQWRREQAWMASAWYQVVSAKSSGVGVGAGAGGGAAGAGGGQVGNTWLAQQRRLLSEHIMKQF